MKPAGTILNRSFLSAAFLAAASAASAQCTVSATVLSGDGYTPGSQLRVLVSVTSNTSGFTPEGVAFRMSWPTANLDWGYDPAGAPPPIFLEDVELGTAYAGPSTETDGFGTSWRDIATLGSNSSATPATPQCFIANFTVGATPTVPYTISIGPDPGNPGDPPGSVTPVAYFTLIPPAAGAITPVTYQNLDFEQDIDVPATFDTGSALVATGGSANIPLSNTGNAPVTVTALGITDNAVPAGVFSITGPATPFTINPGSPVNVSIAFAPAAPTAYSGATLDVTSDSPGETSASVVLSGTGVAGDLSAPASVSFGTVGVGGFSDQGVSLDNAGSGLLTVSGLSINDNGDPAGTFALLSPPSTPFGVAVSGSQSLTVRFTPPSTTNFSSAQIVVASDSFLEPSVSIPLSGIGGSSVLDWSLH